MPICGICRKSEDLLKSFDDFVGEPPILLSRLLIKCTRGTKCKFVLQGVCSICSDDLINYYEAILTAKKIRRKLMELIENQSLQPQESDWQEVEKLFEVVADDNSIVEERSQHIQDIIVKDEDMEDSNSQHVYSEYDEDMTQDYATDTEEPKEEEKEELEEIQESDTEDEGEDIQKSCAECGAVFQDATSWKMHQRDKHRQGYMCDQCGKILMTRDGLAMHLKTHDPDKPLACKICGKRYHFEIHLKNHMAWHTGEKPYECKICKKRFVNYGLLSNHKIIHKELPEGIECNICGKRFRQPCRLNQHMLTHSKEKPYSCNYCDYRFASKYHLTSHLKCNKKCSQLYKNERTLDELKEFVVQVENM